MRLSYTVWHTSVAHRSSRHRLFRNLILWLCIVVLALQPLETLAAVQQRAWTEPADQGRVSAEGADFAEKGWTVALRDASQAPAGLVSAALFGALPTPTGSGGSSSVSTALAHLERLQQLNPTPNRFVGSAGDTESGGSGGGYGGFGGGGAPVGSPALALLLPQTSDPEPANRLPGPYTYASHRPMQGNGGTSALPGGDPSLFAAWLLGLEANEDLGGLAGLGQALVRVFLYVACVLDGECLASLTELQALGEELGSSAQVTMRWTAKLLSRAADLWPLLPNIPRPLADLMSLGLGFTPVVGDLLDLYAGLTGYDPITGEHLPEWAQALALAAVFMPLVSASQLRYADDALGYADEAQDAGRFIGRGCNNSFSAETTVQTEDGPQAITEVEVGDQVLAYDEATGATGYFTVTATLVHLDPVVVYLTLGDETIETTPEHPFYVIESVPWVTLGKVSDHWVAAGELTVGDLVRRSDGSTGVVQAVVIVAQLRAMYNLTVADAHTFFVGDGQWLVHNACIVDYGSLDSLRRPTGIIAMLTSPRVKVPNEARYTPVGFDLLPGNDRARGHLLAAMLGGSGTRKENFVALYQSVNNGVMRRIEDHIQRAVDAGETVIYQVTPIYKGADLVPVGVTIEAAGDQGLDIVLSILNRKPRR